MRATDIFKGFGMARKACALSGEPCYLMPCGTCDGMVLKTFLRPVGSWTSQATRSSGKRQSRAGKGLNQKVGETDDFLTLKVSRDTAWIINYGSQSLCPKGRAMI